MNSEKRFKTKTGYCHILPDQIILTRDGIIGNIAKVTVGNTIARILTIYGFISLGLVYYAIDKFKKHYNLSAILISMIAAYMIFGIFNSLNNSATPVIDRQSIHKIKFIKGITGLTRSRFVVVFTDDKGKTKKRLIMLPGSLTGGQTETDIAYNIMIEEKLIEK
ncbi:MAG: phosphoribosylaminoimidazolesuccinocarboxamide synthase [Candidatus Delongbacteria bacterium]|nr:phosphoribosylaminoimidazolesuccinocarboxamide synthase [Candidatus Delongbacteria bacterium]